MENNNQDTDYTPITIPEKWNRKVIITILSCFFILTILSLFLYTLLINKTNNNSSRGTVIFDKTPKITHVNPATTIKIRGFSIENSNVNDPVSTVLIGQEKKMYALKLDGSPPQILTQFDDEIHSLVSFSNNKKYVYVKTKSENEEDKIEYMEPLHRWLLDINNPTDTLKNIVNFKSEDIRHVSLEHTFTNGEYVYTKENGQDKIDIESYDIFSDSVSHVITIDANKGKEEICKQYETMSDIYCGQWTVPGAHLIPSYDGSWLLNGPAGGGGLGQPAGVMSRDGNTFYALDFSWYGGNSAIWIDDNILLLNNSNSGEGLFRVTVDKNKIDNKKGDKIEGLGSDINQTNLSPSRKLLVIQGDNTTLSLIDTESLKLISKIEIDIDSILTKNNLNEKSVKWPSFNMIGWNLSSTKFIFAYSIRIPAGENDPTNAQGYREDKTIENALYLYDIEQKKLFRIASLDAKNPVSLSFY